MKVPLRAGHGMSVGAAGLPFGTTILVQYQMDMFLQVSMFFPGRAQRPSLSVWCEMHKSGQILATTLSHCLRG